MFGKYVQLFPIGLESIVIKGPDPIVVHNVILGVMLQLTTMLQSLSKDLETHPFAIQNLYDLRLKHQVGIDYVLKVFGKPITDILHFSQRYIFS